MEITGAWEQNTAETSHLCTEKGVCLGAFKGALPQGARVGHVQSLRPGRSILGRDSRAQVWFCLLQDKRTQGMRLPLRTEE